MFRGVNMYKIALKMFPRVLSVLFFTRKKYIEKNLGTDVWTYILENSTINRGALKIRVSLARILV